MVILREKISKNTLLHLDSIGEESVYFDYMVKAVVDIKKEIIAINAELHADLETYLITHGSNNQDLWGFNIDLDTFELEYDSMINPPRNREMGYPRAGRDVAPPAVREKIMEITKKWIEI